MLGPRPQGHGDDLAAGVVAAIFEDRDQIAERRAARGRSKPADRAADGDPIEPIERAQALQEGQEHGVGVPPRLPEALRRGRPDGLVGVVVQARQEGRRELAVFGATVPRARTAAARTDGPGSRNASSSSGTRRRGSRAAGGALHPEFGLVVTARASNYGVGPVPFGAGFHPYLSLHGQPLKDVTLMVPASRRLLLDEALVPVGVQDVTNTPYDLRLGPKLKALRLDDALTGLEVRDGRGTAEVRTKSGGARVWFDETFQYLQVFTADDFRGWRPGRSDRADDLPG